MNQRALCMVSALLLLITVTTGRRDEGERFTFLDGDPVPAFRLDLNKAGRGELESLPGIGPSLGTRILKYRSENGRFRSVESLGSVPGIGTSKLDVLGPYLSVTDERPLLSVSGE